MRVNMSAIGSVIPIISLRRLPAGLDQAGNVTLPGMIAQAEPAHTKSSVKCPRAPAQGASIVFPDFELVRHFRFDAQTLFRQWTLL
jgi:hypothetical protein